MFIFLDKKREKLSQWLKRKTTMDFSDWGVFILFMVGLFPILYFEQNIKFTDKLSTIVLWFTAIVVMQYTKETYWLKQISVKQLENEKRPVVSITAEGLWACSFMLKNIGRGCALNIMLEIAQLNEKKELINISNLAGDFKKEFYNLGAGDDQSTSSFCEIIDDYKYIKKENLQIGVRGVFVIIAIYNDIGNKPYYTTATFEVRKEENDYVLKNTRSGNYDKENIKKIF